jgi:hypothetical protein
MLPGHALDHRGPYQLSPALPFPADAERWPLMLDPQLQGVAWVKERLGGSGLVCVRMGAPDMLRSLEKAISEVGPSGRLAAARRLV